LTTMSASMNRLTGLRIEASVIQGPSDLSVLCTGRRWRICGGSAVL
jgi:hypothetical protein